MPWAAKNDPEMCSVEMPWAVLKTDDGALMGCHATQSDAEEHVAKLYMSEGGRPGEYNHDDPPEEAGVNTNPAGVTVNINYPSTTDVNFAKVWRTTTGTNTAFDLYPQGLRRNEDPEEGKETPEDDEVVPEEVPDAEGDTEEGDGGEVEDPVDPEGEVEEPAEPDPEGDGEEEPDEEVELEGDPDEARARVHPVPTSTRQVTRSATNDYRGIPSPVLERLAETRADVGVIDRVGRGACEFRFKPELRFNQDGTVFVHGYATVYDFPYDVAGGPPFGWSETIVRDACRVSVQQGADVRLLINHEGIPLARTKSGTLRLESDDIGLYNAAPSLDPRSPTVQSLISAMSRGDLDEMSFAFRVKEQEWNDDFTERHITEVILFDVSMVTYPANPATVSTTRSEPTQLTLSDAMLQLRQMQVRGDRLRMTP